MRKFPKYIPIFGKKCPIYFVKGLKNAEGQELDGQFNRLDFYIELDASLNYRQAKETLIHEIVHAALHRRHISLKLSDDLEEDIVRCVEDLVVETLTYSFKKELFKD